MDRKFTEIIFNGKLIKKFTYRELDNEVNDFMSLIVLIFILLDDPNFEISKEEIINLSSEIYWKLEVRTGDYLPWFCTLLEIKFSEGSSKMHF